MFGGVGNKQDPAKNSSNDIDDGTNYIDNDAGEETDKKYDATGISDLIDNKLKEINDHDYKQIEQHKTTIIEKLKNQYDINDVRFGGSHSTHTDIKNLSDIDLLVDLGEFSSEYSSEEIIKNFAENIKERLPNTEITFGAMAVTIEFTSGITVQVLPAYRSNDEYMIPDPNGQGWIPTQPKNFSKKVTELNNKHSNQIVPTIKIVKLMCEVNNINISSYHVSNMVLNAFENYPGPKTIPKMVSYFFTQAISLCSQPTIDPSGQSKNIDDDLSEAKRKELAKSFSKVEVQIKNAIKSQSLETWKRLLEK